MASRAQKQSLGEPKPKRRLFVAFSVKGYAWFWISMFWSSAAMSGGMVAQAWLVLELTEGNSTPIWLGVVTAVRAVGSVLLSPLTGIIIDRFDRRHILVALQVLNMATSLVLGTLVITGWVVMWHLILISLFQGLIMAVSMPARNAMTFDLVGREALMNAISANYVASDIMRIVSPVISGVIIHVVGTGGAFFFLSGSLAIATYCVLRLPPTETKPRGQRSVWASLRDGASYASRNPNMRVIMILDILMSIFAYAAQLMLPVFAVEVLGVGSIGLGVLTGAMGVGGMTTSLVIASSPRIRPTHLRYFLASLGYCLMVIAWAVSPWYALAMVFLYVNGVASGGYNSVSSSLVQVVAPEEYRARMIGLQGFTWGTFSLGGLVIGGVATVIGVSAALAALAAIPGVACLYLLTIRRRFSAEPEDQI